MDKKKRDMVYFSLFIVFVIGYVVYALVAKHNLEKDHNLTVANTYDCSANGRGNAGGLYIEYTYKIDGRQYKETAALSTSELSLDDCKEYFIGKDLPLVYLPSNPSNSSLLIRPIDFKRFGYPFPDSLKWVLKYVNSK
jgi:hypothetical protein